MLNGGTLDGATLNVTTHGAGEAPAAHHEAKEDVHHEAGIDQSDKPRAGSESLPRLLKFLSFPSHITKPHLPNSMLPFR